MTAQPTVDSKNKSNKLELAFMGATQFQLSVFYRHDHQAKLILDGY